MKQPRPILALAGLALAILLMPVISTSHALLINLGLDEVRDAGGNPIGTNALAMIVVDKNASGTFDIPEDAWATTVGNFGADYIAWRGDFSSFGTPGVFTDSPSFTIGTVDVPFNVAFGLYWFPTLTTGTTVLSTGDAYGFYTSTDATQFASDSAWNTGGSDSGTLTINAYSIDNTGNLATNPQPGGLANTALQATASVVPEPGIWGLFVGGLTIVMVYRRRCFTA